VGIWLAFLQKHAYYGIGMKANVWNFDKLGMYSYSLGTSAGVLAKLILAQELARIWMLRWKV